ncbi:MAG: hypothetical protein AAF752_10935, partial [Bacteroidota bacterium]
MSAGPVLNGAPSFRHGDPAGGAMVLQQAQDGSLVYLRHEFKSGASYISFDEPLVWLPANLAQAGRMEQQVGFTHYTPDGSTDRGAVTYIIAFGAAVNESVIAKNVSVLTAVHELTVRTEAGRSITVQQTIRYADWIGPAGLEGQFLTVGENGDLTAGEPAAFELTAFTP